MNDTLKQRIFDRLAGIRFSYEQEAVNAGGAVYANVRGKLQAVEVIEKMLSDLFAEINDEND